MNKTKRRETRGPTAPVRAKGAGRSASMRRQAEWRGRSVVVTGGAAGIGRAIALAFGRAGARVTVLDIDRAGGRQTLEAMRAEGADGAFLEVDLAETRQVKRAARILREGGGIDVLVNNAAATGRIVPFPQVRPAECETVLRANVLGPFLLSQLAAQDMIARGRSGTIINVLTIQTGAPVPGYSAYVTSKGAMDALTLSMAVDLAPFGIRVNGIRVGSVVTENFIKHMPDKLKQLSAETGTDPAALLDARAATLLNRMGRPEEIANLALFLASGQTAFLTGSIVRVDGGRAISRKVEPLL